MAPLLASSMSTALQDLQYPIRTIKIRYKVVYLQKLVGHMSDMSMF